MPDIVRIVIADDHPIFRQGLVATIQKNPSHKVIGEAANGLEALEIIESLAPDVVILDIDMPVLDGIETARILSSRNAVSEQIFLTMHRDISILRALSSLNVSAYVLKDSAIDEIGICIENVVAGRKYLSPSLNDLIFSNLSEEHSSKIFLAVKNLTSSERKILSLIAESKTNKEIAEELCVAIRTVETHRYNICSKLGINGPNSLLKFAIQNKNKLH